MFRIDYDLLVAQGKIRRAGFDGFPDTGSLLLQGFSELRDARLIP